MFYGQTVRESVGIEAGNPNSAIERIPAHYFAVWRGFDETSNRIDAFSPFDAESELAGKRPKAGVPRGTRKSTH